MKKFLYLSNFYSLPSLSVSFFYPVTARKDRVRLKDIRAGIDHLFASTEREIQDIEKHVQEKPGQSILLAFAVGLFASYMLGGRR